MKTTQVPYLLIYFRILCAFIIGTFGFIEFEWRDFSIISLMVLALVSDIFDGVIARKTGTDSARLRIWDSTVDLFFWLVTIATIFYLNQDFVMQHLFALLSVLFLELFCYFICYIRFKRLVATHTWLAKIWTLFLLVFLVDLCLHGQSFLPFILCIIFGLISRLEINLIVLRLKKWRVDIPSIFHLQEH